MTDLNEMSYEELQKLAYDVWDVYQVKRIAKASAEGTDSDNFLRIRELEPIILACYDTSITLGEAIVQALEGCIIRDMHLDWDDMVDLIKEMFDVDLDTL